MAPKNIKTDIAILGAGIGGFEAFRSLHRELCHTGIRKKILLIDKNDYFTFKPLLHEVVSGSVEPPHAILPLSEVIAGTAHGFLQTCVQKLKPLEKIVETDKGPVSYEYCILALGSEVNYFDIPGAKKFSHSVNSLPEALCLREALIKCLEEPTSAIFITIVGGGYTGVEVAGQIAYLARHEFAESYPQKHVAVSIVESGSTIAKTLPPRAQRKALVRLNKLGVQLHFNKTVQEVTKDTVALADGTSLPSHLTVWAAGIRNIAPEIIALEGCSLEKGCLPVNDYLFCSTCPSLYAIGDIAYFCPPGGVSPAPQLGEAAHKEGEYVAKHIVAKLRGKKIKPFRFVSKGTIMPIGDHYGLVVLRNKVALSGLIAWWIRRFVYVVFMPGLKRKLKLMLDWSLPPFNVVDIIKKRKKLKKY